MKMIANIDDPNSSHHRTSSRSQEVYHSAVVPDPLPHLHSKILPIDFTRKKKSHKIDDKRKEKRRREKKEKRKKKKRNKAKRRSEKRI